MGIAKYRIDLTNLKGCLACFLNQNQDLKLYELRQGNEDENRRLTIKQFISKYESNITIRYILGRDPYNFHSKIFGDMREICMINDSKPKKLSNDNEFGNIVISSNSSHSEVICTFGQGSKNNTETMLQGKMISIKPCVKVQSERLAYKMKQVEEFFSDIQDNKYQRSDQLSLEQSPCCPVINSQVGIGRIWYYCKLHPDIVCADLSSIEFHCKSFKPEEHKSELLKLLNEQME